MVIEVIALADGSTGAYRVMSAAQVQYLLERPDGVYSASRPDAPWWGMVCQIPYPPEDGKTETSGSQTCTVEGTELVETSLGTFMCVKIHYTVSEPEGLEWTAWFGQGIGLVKYIGWGRDLVYHVRELRNYHLN